MAEVMIVYKFADGDTIQTSVKVEASYPDALDQAKATAVATFKDVLGSSVDTLAAEINPPDEGGE
jgi:hypothetical protein